MSRITKNELKSIVKECLVEILAEGLIPGNISPTRKRKNLSEAISNHKNNTKTSISKLNKGKKVSHNQRSYLDSIKYQNNTNTNNNSKINTLINKTSARLSSDPLMRDILADTAKNTLQEQISAESNKKFTNSKPADAAARVVSENDPSDIFGGASKNWATLAFS